jgi:aspartate racemase
MSSELDKLNIRHITPDGDGMNVLAKLILEVKAKGDMAEITKAFDGVTAAMRGRGADYFVLACTEIPLIVQSYNFKFPFVDCTTELAKAAIKACGYVYERAQTFDASEDN